MATDAAPRAALSFTWRREADSSVVIPESVNNEALRQPRRAVGEGLRWLLAAHRRLPGKGTSGAKLITLSAK